MSNLKQNEEIHEASAQPQPKRLSNQKARGGATLDQTQAEWTYPPSTFFVHPSAPPTRASSRKRRVYADYRELLALESQANKLHFLSRDSARSLPTEPQAPQLCEPTLDFPKQLLTTSRDENNISGLSEAQTEQLDLPVPAPAEQPAILIVDQRMNMFFGSRRNLKSVVAANAAALIAWRMLAQGRRIGAIVFNDQKIVQFRPCCGRLQTLLILQTVLNQNHSLQPDAGIFSNPTILNDALRRANKFTEDNPLIFLLTDASGCDRETFRLATNLSQRSDLLVTLVYDPRQADLFGTREPGTRRSARALRRKNGNILRRHDLVATGMFPDGVPVVPINTQDDVAYQIRRGFTKWIFSSFARVRHPQANSLSLEVQP